MEGRTVVILIDALGDEIARAHDFQPTSLGYRTRLRTVLGFSQAALTSILTGATPAEHGLWMMYRFDRRRSPFRFVDALAPFGGTGRRMIRDLIRWKVGRLDRVTGYYSLYRVPAGILSRLDLPARRSVFERGGGGRCRTVLDEASLRGDLFVRDYRTPSAQAFDDLEESLRAGRAAFNLLYTAELDSDLHAYGTRDRRVGERLDAFAERIDRIARTFSDARLLVLGDHGMCDVCGTADLMGKVEKAGLGALTDLIPFYDSTMARFSVRQGDTRRRLEDLLSSLPGGRLLSDREREDLGVPAAECGYGDPIFLCDPGIVILPSHMSIEPVAGMHGYHPDAPCMDSLLLSRDPIPPGISTICDLAPLLLPGFVGGEGSA
ncbi:MAG: alkaline phosphatase family protein [Candidatus Krumholzibacteria bacterium]|nr:alkaline phosphatase family protein [Candidatus Krumholzibacteria bacterium]